MRRFVVCIRISELVSSQFWLAVTIERLSWFCYWMCTTIVSTQTNNSNSLAEVS